MAGESDGANMFFANRHPAAKPKPWEEIQPPNNP
jgi:hypothetical protein